MAEDDDIIRYTYEDLGKEVTSDELIADIKEDLEEDHAEEEELLKEDLEAEGFVPQSEKDLSQIAFLERNLEKKDKISIANLTNEELGKPVLSIRFWRQYASIFDGTTLYDMPLVHTHLLKKAKINEATSLSREAKALELAFTSKRVRERKASKEVSEFMTHIQNKEQK